MTTFQANIPVWIPAIWRSQLIKGYYLNNCLLDMFGFGDNPDVTVNGGNIRWGGQTDGTNNAAATAEGAAALAPNIDSAIPLTIPLVAFESNPATTYEAVDFSASDVDPHSRAIFKGAEQLRDAANTVKIVSWVAAINAALPNYAGQARAGFPRLLVPGADAAAVALSIPALGAALEFLMTPPRRVAYQDLGIFMGPALATRYSAISNQAIDAVRAINRDQGALTDGGYGLTMPDAYWTGMVFDGVKVYSVPGFPVQTVAIGPRTGPMRPYIPNVQPVITAANDDPNAAIMDGIRMVRKHPAGRSEFVQMDTYSELIVPRPGDWFLMTAKT